jgi:alkylation response protein AidB-like acyl-CoA dehydrogenase
MDFNDTPEEAAYRAKARAWLAANAELIDPNETARDPLSEREDEGTIDAARAWQARKFDAGWACITWPKEYGGQGGTTMQSVIFNQEQAKFKTPPPIYTIGHGMLGPTIMTHGTPEQKTKHLKAMARGEQIWCQLFSEPAAGSDLAGLRSTAVRDGSDWILNGQKIWSTGAHFCKWGMIVVRTDPNAGKHAGLTYFILDMESKGIEIRPIKQINGGSGFNEVFYTDVRVPDSDRLGAVGDGWRVALTTLMNERVAIGAGSPSGGFRNLLKLARETKRRGRPALEDSSVRQKLADFWVKQQGLKYTGFRTLSALSQGKVPGPEGSIGKAVGAPMVQDLAAFAVELQGPLGATRDHAASVHEALWQNMWLGVPGMRVAGGTDEILKNIIAERVLRLPPEFRLDKDIAFRDIPTGPPGK